MSTQKRGYTTAECAYYTGLSESYLRQARMKHGRKMDAPKHTSLSCRKIIYLKEDLDIWLDQQKANTNELEVR